MLTPAELASSLIFIVDALDECDNQEDIEPIQQSISQLGNSANTYMLIVGNSMAENYTQAEKDEIITQCKIVVGTIVVLFDSLSSAAFCNLLCLQSDLLGETIRALASVLETSVHSHYPIRPLHGSSRRFQKIVV